MRTSAPAPATPLLVLHLVYRFDCGGLQTVIAECINHMPAERYRHVVVGLTACTDYIGRVQAPDVRFYGLNKSPGQDFTTHLKFWKLLRRLRPAVVHTYNIGTIEYNLTALLAGVPVRVHSEHGRDSVEIDGKHRKYNLLRRLMSPVVDCFVSVSSDLCDWLHLVVKLPKAKIAMIPNGVSTRHDAPNMHSASPPPVGIHIGTVGRIDHIKNHHMLLDAFALLLSRFPSPASSLRLVIVGDGPLLRELRDRVEVQGLADRVWLPGARSDIADILRGFSVFVLPSRSEAMPMTILEAMAAALPVVATRVGGIPQLVLDGETGALVPPDDVEALVDALSMYIDDPARCHAHGLAGQARVRAAFSVDAMVTAYVELYDGFCRGKAGALPT